MSYKKQSALKEKLDQFLDAIPFDDIAADVAGKSNEDVEAISFLLDTYANESHVALEVVADHLGPADRILEVGAGLCLLSLFLKSEGYSVVALEPALGGFGIFEQTKNSILDHFSSLRLKVLSKPAQQLNALEDGAFDLVYSNNVMEHIPDWRAALTAMASVLKADGKMLHACPNYTIPYEPHYGVPVFRHFRDFSQRVFLPKDVDADIWNSLNFITCSEVRNYCKAKQLSCEFKKSMLHNAFSRIHDDPLFKERHQGFIAIVANVMTKPPFQNLIKNIPPSLATPMVVTISHRVSAER